MKRSQAWTYGRRHKILVALRNAHETEQAVARLREQLRASPIPRDDQRRLLANVERYEDVTRRHRAIWAIVDALEAVGH